MNTFLTKNFKFKNNSYKVCCYNSKLFCSWKSFIEEESIRNEFWSISKGDCVFDIGAYLGSYSLTAAACGASKVFAWSPKPYDTMDSIPAIEFLKRSISINNFNNICEVHDFGFYSKNGHMDLNGELCEQSQHSFEVKVFDEWYGNQNFGSFNKFWLKLDVEGSELEILKTSKNMINDLKPNILVENHECFRKGIGEEVRKLIKSYGYSHSKTITSEHVSHSFFEYF